MNRFVHLHLHSEFSLEDGIVKIKPMMTALKAFGSPAVALSDLNNLFAAVKFYKAATSQGIKPIFAADLNLFDEKHPDKPARIVCLCQNDKGYHNLTTLVSKAYLEQNHQGLKVVRREWLETYQEGLILLSGGLKGIIARRFDEQDIDAVAHELNYFKERFGNRFYLEITRLGHAKEEDYITAALKWSVEHTIPLVATNEVCFLEKTDFEAHEARVCIHQGYVLDDDSRPKGYTAEQYLKTPEEMSALFQDIPEAISNTVEIAKRCNVSLSLGKNYLPTFPTRDGSSEAQYLQSLAREGLEKRLPVILSGIEGEEKSLKIKAYDERLDIELGVINQMGFPGYFLIVADFIQWAKNNGVPVGPGRGSGAGSLVAYALEITDLDPLEFDLLFERFLNPERVSMPDFDIDFCMEGRDSVIEYVQETYGRDAVSQIITFGTMAAKAVVRDVGRVLGHPYGFVDRIAKLIPFEIGMTLDKALEQEERLQALVDEDSDVSELITLAKKLEGITRNAGKHAGGVVIAPSQLTDFTAIYSEPDSSQIVSQFDKDDVEAAGLVKFDFLGLRTLTIINWALLAINAKQTQPVDIALIDIDDSKTFDLLKACKTTAVFQLESRGMKELISRLQPDCFEEIIALVALFRPGPLQSGMVDDFIDRKHGRAKVIYPHPKLEPILKPTYGVILYQEQVMQIAQVLAGYSLGAADILRRAMGKKKPEEMAAQRKIFTEGAIANQVEEETATYIFDLMEKFAGYGFNKSHSAAYALIAYQTAWLKTHYPAEFMAAVLSSDMDNTDKVVTFINECKNESLTVLPPSVNDSQYKFVATNVETVRYGLGAIKGVGEAAINLILEEREAGAFHTLFDFCARLDLRKVNRRVIEALIYSGAMDSFKQTRETLIASLDKAIKVAEKIQSNLKLGQIDLFQESDQVETYLESNLWLEIEVLEKERLVLGLYFSSHPFDHYIDDAKNLKTTPLAQVSSMMNKTVKVMGLIVSVRRLITKQGKRMAIVALDDKTAEFEVTFFEEALTDDEILQKNHFVVIECEISQDNYTGGVRGLAKQAYSLTKAREHFFKSVVVYLTDKDVEKVASIKQLLVSSKGQMPVKIAYKNQSVCLKLNVSENYYVMPTDALVFRLKTLLSQNALTFA